MVKNLLTEFAGGTYQELFWQKNELTQAFLDKIKEAYNGEHVAFATIIAGTLAYSWPQLEGKE